mmetsp:Transcript_38392/g.96578  ORF Transcript_38392/g.96578 Transcript_38392/m.96578 type:complete len:267 (-) Transcript_38392:21-821(-)
MLFVVQRWHFRLFAILHWHERSASLSRPQLWQHILRRDLQFLAQEYPTRLQCLVSLAKLDVHVHVLSGILQKYMPTRPIPRVHHHRPPLRPPPPAHPVASSTRSICPRPSPADPPPHRPLHLPLRHLLRPRLLRPPRHRPPGFRFPWQPLPLPPSSGQVRSCWHRCYCSVWWPLSQDEERRIHEHSLVRSLRQPTLRQRPTVSPPPPRHLASPHRRREQPPRPVRLQCLRELLLLFLQLRLPSLLLLQAARYPSLVRCWLSCSEPE